MSLTTAGLKELIVASVEDLQHASIVTFRECQGTIFCIDRNIFREKWSKKVALCSRFTGSRGGTPNETCVFKTPMQNCERGRLSIVNGCLVAVRRETRSVL